MIACLAVSVSTHFSPSFQVIDARDVDKFINPETPIDEALELIKPYSGSDLQFYPVSSRMNNQRYDAPDCKKKIELTDEKMKQAKLSNFFIKKDPGTLAILLNDSEARNEASGASCTSCNRNGTKRYQECTLSTPKFSEERSIYWEF